MNKHILHTTFIALVLMLTLAPTVPAEDMDTGQSTGMSHSMDMPVDMDHSAHNNMPAIRETMVDGYHLVYKLIDMRKRMEGMENMPPMDNTHHLMVYIHSPNGHMVVDARVGYLVTAPDGETQKAMAMAMAGGYGADINLEEKGAYTISVKALLDDADLRDRFKYEIK